jgi:hypothetical protein
VEKGIYATKSGENSGRISGILPKPADMAEAGRHTTSHMPKELGPAAALCAHAGFHLGTNMRAAGIARSAQNISPRVSATFFSKPYQLSLNHFTARFSERAG